MLCEQCKKNEATVHAVEIRNGVRQEHYYCADCATEAGIQTGMPSLMEFLSLFKNAQPQQQLPVCQCGRSLCEFEKLGLLGCPQCYTTYKSALLPVIKRMQAGRLHHVGRAPAGANTPANAQAPSESICLQEELKRAIQEERYERAAELRDRIRALEGGEPA